MWLINLLYRVGVIGEKKRLELLVNKRCKEMVEILKRKARSVNRNIRIMDGTIIVDPNYIVKNSYRSEDWKTLDKIEFINMFTEIEEEVDRKVAQEEERIKRAEATMIAEMKRTLDRTLVTPSEAPLLQPRERNDE